MAATLAVSSTLPSLALAQDVTVAQDLFNRGLEQMEAGQYEKACPLLAESFRVYAGPGTLFTLAECEAKRGRIATALQRYSEYLSLHATLTADKKRKQGDRERTSREAIASLETSVPELTLRLPPNTPAGVTVSVDGVPLPASALGAPMRLDPGTHDVVVQTQDGRSVKRRLRIGKQEKTMLVLPAVTLPESGGSPPVQADRAIPGTTSPELPFWGTQRVVGAGIAGAGLIGIGIGSAVGLQAIAKKNDSNSDRHCVGNNCDAVGTQLRADAFTAAGISTAVFIAGASILAGGVVVFATAPRGTTSADVKATVSLGSIKLSGGW